MKKSKKKNEGVAAKPRRQGDEKGERREEKKRKKKKEEKRKKETRAPRPHHRQPCRLHPRAKLRFAFGLRVGEAAAGRKKWRTLGEWWDVGTERRRPEGC